MKSKQSIYYILLASFVFAIMAACSKLLAPDMGILEQVFVRNLVGMIVLGLSFIKSPIKLFTKTTKPLWILLSRGLLGTIGLIAQFYNATTMPLGEAMTFFHSNVLFVSLFAAIFLKEKLGSRWIPVVLGILGMIIIFKPSPDLFRLDHFISGLSCAIFVGLAYTAVRGLREFFETRIIVMSLMAFGIFLPLILLPFAPASINLWGLPSLMNIPVLIIFCFVSIFGQIWVTKAYALGKASVVSVLGLSGIIFGLILGLLLGDPFPDLFSLLGIILVLTAGIIISIDHKRHSSQNTSN